MEWDCPTYSAFCRSYLILGLVTDSVLGRIEDILPELVCSSLGFVRLAILVGELLPAVAKGLDYHLATTHITSDVTSCTLPTWPVI